MDKIIKTLIYGVKSSGNQAECALRTTARKQSNNYPEAAKAILEDTYVDDCATRGGFCTKGFIISNKPPLPSMRKDGISVNVAGIKWYSEEDVTQLAIGPLNFTKKQREEICQRKCFVDS